MSVRRAKNQISLGIRPVWSESSLCALWVAKDPRFLHAERGDSDQTGRMPRLIWVFARRTLILLVLSCRGSSTFCHPQYVCPETEIWKRVSLVMRKYNRWTALSPFCVITDSNWPAQLHNLIWGLKIWLQKLETLHYLGSEQQRRWSDSADAQADLRLCWSHMTKDTFSHGPAQL